MPRQPLSPRYSSAVLTLLERAGMRVDAFSVLGDTLTVEATAFAVVNVLTANGGVEKVLEQLPNRIYAVVCVETQYVTIRQSKSETFTTVTHWHPNAKLRGKDELRGA